MPRPCTKIVPTLVPLTFVNVTAAVPATVPFCDTVSRFPSLLVTVTVTGDGGTAASVIDSEVCRSRPTTVSEILTSGADTAAVICWKLLGVVNPDGVARPSVVVPVALGWNARPGEVVEDPPMIVAGEPTMSPTLVLELVTLKFKVRPPRSAWVCTKEAVAGFKRDVTRLSPVSAEKVVVERLLEFQTTPDGSIVTLLVPSLYPAA